MRLDIITIFPEIFTSYFKEGMIRKAIEKKLIEIHVHNLRDFAANKHKKVDDIPYGGGPGMVLTPQPLYDAIIQAKSKNSGPVIYLSPKGKTLTHSKSQTLAKKSGLILVCGRYEGIDQRIIDLLVDEEISIGKYILTGGELPAMVLLDSVSRFIPKVLGDDLSSHEETFSKALNGKKEYPYYTRPPVFKELEVPKVLQNGNHAEIKKWKQNNLQ